MAGGGGGGDGGDGVGGGLVATSFLGFCGVTIWEIFYLQ